MIIFISFLITLPSISTTSQNRFQNSNIFVDEVVSLNPGILDPATTTKPQALGFIQLMYDGFFQYENNSVMELKPGLASSAPFISADGLVYNFSIRSGVTFTLQPGEKTGQPINAYVMQYSIDRAIIMNAHNGPAWMLDQWIKGAQAVENAQNLNVAQVVTFLNQRSVKALNKNTLQITLSKPSIGFLQALTQPVADAVSPKAIIDNEPTIYTTKQDSTFSMVSLASFFPGINNATILQNLGLPITYNIDNSGVVPQSDPNSLAAYTWLKDHSAGTGPYYLVDLVQGIFVDLAKNNNWWNSYYFQNAAPTTIQVTQVANSATRIKDLKQGSINEGDIPYSDLSEFGVTATNTTPTTNGISSYVYRNFTNVFIGMNINNSLPSDQIIENTAISNYNYGSHNVSKLLKYSWNDSNGKPQMASPNNPFSALLFRKAFAYAFPTSAFIDQALFGFGIRMQGAVPEGILDYNSSLITNGNIPTYNSSEAHILFNQIGWKGTILMSYNSKFTLGSISTTLLAQAINSLNVNITIKPNPIASVNWNPLSNQYALFQSSYTSTLPVPSTYINAFYVNGTFAKSINYNNPFIEKLIIPVYTNASSYYQIEVNATGDYPYIYVSQEENVLLVSKSIEGILNPESDSLNPMLYFLPLQYLAEATNLPNSIACINCSSESLTSVTKGGLNSLIPALFNLNIVGLTVTASAFLLGISTVYILFTYVKYRKTNKHHQQTKLRFWVFLRNTLKIKKNKPQQVNSLSPETLDKIEQIIDENKEN